MAGKAGFPGGATYCATKHAVVGLSEAIRAEVRGTGVDVSVVMPVVVNTELGSGLPETRSFKPMQPEDESAVPSDGPAKYAVEINQGEARRAGVKPGDVLDIPEDVRDPGNARPRGRGR